MDYEFENCEVEDVLQNIKPKKKINSKKKGNRVELELTKILTNRFGKPFSRAVGSGNRWGQVANLPKHAKETLTGDICPPEGFKWVIECKGGYEDKIDLNNLGQIAQLDAFIQQSTDDASRSNRKPIILWKRARKPWLAMVRNDDLVNGELLLFDYKMHYCEWVILPFEKLLEITKDEFWFE